MNLKTPAGTAGNSGGEARGARPVLPDLGKFPKSRKIRWQIWKKNYNLSNSQNPKTWGNWITVAEYEDCNVFTRK